MVRRAALIFSNPLGGLLAERSLSGALVFVGLIPLGIFLLLPLQKKMHRSTVGHYLDTQAGKNQTIVLT